MEKRCINGLGALALCMWLGGTAVHAQVAPNGWIQTQNWNMMFPLLNPDGCGGGGAAGMAENWVAPHVIGSEDPKALTVWNDIDFGGTARATGWGAEALNPDPIWVTNAALESAFGLVAGSIPNGDVVDFQGMVDYVNTNIVAGLPGPPPNLPGDNVMSLATTYVENTTGAPLVVDICSASDDSVQVWVNNTMPTNVSACRGTAGDCAERNTSILPPGISKLSVLTFEGGGGWGFRLALEVDGQKATDTNGLGITFLGAGTDEVGQLQYAVDRTRGAEDPLECAGAEDAELTLLGNGAGNAADALTVVETITHDQGADITIDAPGATVEDILPVDDRRPVGIFDDHRIIGNADCTDVGAAVPSGSDTTEAAGVYTQSAAGNSDVWNGGDTFEYAYNRYEGDFDISIKILSKEHLESGDNWNKFGLMVRDQLVSCSRHYFQVDVLPNSRRQVQARSDANTCGASWSEEGYAQVGDPPVDVGNNPVYHRITRRAGVIQGWITEDAAVEGDAANDALWFGCNRTEGWSGDAPVYVGLATSEHSGDCGVMVMTCSVLNSTGTQVESFDPRATGKTLTYDTTRGDVDAGLSYTVATASSLNVSISGVVETAAGAPEAFTAGVGSLSLTAGNSGPVGAFDDSRDIGNPPIAGSLSEAGGVYTITGSGNDIWNGGDDFHFAYQYVTGDFVATMRVLSRSVCPERWGRHGIMARYDCRRDAKFSMCETQAPTEWGVANIPEFGGAEDWPRHHFRVFDNNNGNNRDYYQVNDGFFPTDTRLPTWMRLVRVGNALYSYMAEDADADDQPDNWYIVGSDSAVGMPDELLVGVAIHGRANQTTTITFDNMTIETPDDPEDLGICLAADQLQLLEYENADDLGTVVQRAGGFTPAVITSVIEDPDGTPDTGDEVTASRLRLTQEGTGGSATAVWYGVPKEGDSSAPLLDDGFIVEFDAYMTHSIPENPADMNPADGMTFAVVASGKSDGLASAVGPFPTGLDVASLCGDAGGSEGFESGTMRERTESHPSFAIEMDNWVGGGEPGNEPGGSGSPNDDGKYHMGVNINASVSSLQTNVDFGVPTDAMPDIFNPAGVHVEVLYLPTGEIAVWVSGVDVSGAEVPQTQILSALIPSLPSGDVLLGFTGGTGGATCTQEVDNFELKSICCEEIDSVEITGPTAVNQGDLQTYTAVVSGDDGAVTYEWQVVSGNATLSATDTESVDVTFDSTTDTEVVLGVSVNDGTCEAGASAELAITVTLGTPFIRGDCNQDGEVCRQVSDIVRIIEITFLGSDLPDCPAACDANGDGEVFSDVSDALYVANFCFLGTGEPPPAPYPACDFQADADCDGVTFCSQ